MIPCIHFKYYNGILYHSIPLLYETLINLYHTMHTIIITNPYGNKVFDTKLCVVFEFMFYNKHKNKKT